MGPNKKHVDDAVFRTYEYLDSRFRPLKPELPFPRGTDLSLWESWRQELLGALRGVLNLDCLGPVPTPVPEVMETAWREKYLRHTIRYETMPGNWARAFLLVPKGGPARKPAVICPHGHVTPWWVDCVVDPNADPNKTWGVAYAHELARRGMVVLAPEGAGQGTRKSPSDQTPLGCRSVWSRLNLMGLDLTGFRIFELMAGINLLQARDDVRPDRIGAAGLSGGCWQSQVLAALDERIRAVILSGFFVTFEQTVWAEDHCICHYPKGIGRICEMPDVAALIAPRPLFVESGTQDTSYPVEPAFSITKEAYRLLGAEGHIQIDLYEGGHKFRGEKSIPWLVSELSKGGES